MMLLFYARFEKEGSVGAGRIRGIIVEIGGDNTKRQNDLKGVNAEIRNTQSQLRDIEKLLKCDPGNTELLAQRKVPHKTSGKFSY